MLKPLFDIAPLLPDIEAGTLILTPNNRLASKMLDAWGMHLQQQQGARVWSPPAIYAIDNWIGEQWQQMIATALPGAEVTPLSPQQELVLWEQVIEEDSDKPHLLNPAGLAHSAQQASQALQQWCIANSELQSYDEPGLHLLNNWQRAFNGKLKQLNCIAGSELTRRVAAAFASSQLPQWKKILLVDFQTLSPLHRQLLNAATPELIDFQWPQQQAVQSCQRASFKDRDQELQQAAYWARDKLNAQPQSRVGIIIPDLPSRRQQVERVFREVFEPDYKLPSTPHYTAPFNISTATPLASTAMIGAAFQLLQLNRHRLPLDSYAAILNSPFWGDGDNEQPLRALAEKYLRELGAIQPRGLDFRECCNKAANNLTSGVQNLPPVNASSDIRHPTPNSLVNFENLRRQANPRASYHTWQQLFSQQLAALHWPGSRPLNSVEHQQMEHWKNLLEQFGCLDMVSGPDSVNRQQALSQLERLAQTTPFQAQTEDSPLQILGLLEGAGLRFDCLWITGMDDRQWPPSPEPNPLLPIRLQRQHTMPRASAEKELELAQRLLETYRNRADHQLFSYCQFDGDSELAPSALIADIAEGTFESWEQPGHQVPPGKLEVREVGNAPVLDPATESIRGGSGILKDQANCPFNAFARWRLGAQQPNPPGSGLSALERGNILHQTMDLLWAELIDHQTLCTTEQQQLNTLIGSAINNTLRRWRARKPELGNRFFELEAGRLQKLVGQWLAVERQRTAFTVAAREAALEVEFAGLPLNLRIDRIDQTACGQTLLIDYKTGKSTVGSWLGDRPTEPQLPLYALLLEQPPAAISFAIINAEQQCFTGLAEAADLLPDYKSPREPVPEWPELMEHWRDTLEAIASSYRLGEAEICLYNRQTFAFQDELLPLNRWPEQQQIARYLEQQQAHK